MRTLKRHIGRKVVTRATRGSALTELVLIVPVLIAIIYGSLYITDLSLFKLKSLEISRYTAWGLATRPQSAYVSGIVPLVTIASNLTVRGEVQSLYSDLDGAVQWSMPGTSRLTSAAQLLPVELTFETAPLVPGVGQDGYADNLSLLGQIVRVLGIGPNLDSVIASLFDKLGFNGSGYVTGRGPLLITLPWMGNDAYRALTLAQAGAPMNADLSPWSPYPGFIIADKDNRSIQTALLSDPWRLNQGFGVAPPTSRVSGYQLTVQRMQRSLPRLIPVIGLALPGTPGSENLVVVSKPYTSNRMAGDEGFGQINVEQLTGGHIEQGGQIMFETGALYDDAANPGASPYLEELNSRGASFMGCNTSMKRGCRE